MLLLPRHLDAHIKPSPGSQIVRPDPDLVGCWILNEGGGGKVFDQSGQGNHGDCVNSPRWDRNSQGPVVNFDRASTQYISVGHKASLEGMSQLTMRVRFMPPATHQAAWYFVCGKYNGGYGFSSNYSVWFIWDSDPNYIKWFACACIPSNTYWDFATEWLYAPNFRSTWYDLVLVLDGVTGGLYVNGVKPRDFKDRVGGIQSSSQSTFNIGTDLQNGTPTSLLSGKVSDVEVWRRALTQTEVRREYEDPWGRFRKRPVYLWVGATGGTDQTLTPSTQSLSLSIASPATLYDYSAGASVLTASLAVQSPTVSLSPTHQPSVLSLALSQPAATIRYDMTVVPAAQTLALTLPIAQESYDYSLAAAAVALSLAIPSPTIETGISVTVSPSAQSLTLAIQSASAAYDATALASALSLALSQPAASVSHDYIVAVSAALSLASSLAAPTVATGISVTITPSAQGLTLAVQSPAQAYDVRHLVTALQLVAGQQAVTFDYDYAFDVDALPMVLAMREPTISTGMLASACFLLIKKGR